MFVRLLLFVVGLMDRCDSMSMGCGCYFFCRVFI